VFRIPNFEAALAQSFQASALDGMTPILPALNSDLHASADYRAHVITEMVRRAVDAASARKND
jgi:carbon-monoxide dehydrogenase medium subunit